MEAAIRGLVISSCLPTLTRPTLAYAAPHSARASLKWCWSFRAALVNCCLSLSLCSMRLCALEIERRICRAYTVIYRLSTSFSDLKQIMNEGPEPDRLLPEQFRPHSEPISASRMSKRKREELIIKPHIECMHLVRKRLSNYFKLSTLCSPSGLFITSEKWHALLLFRVQLFVQVGLNNDMCSVLCSCTSKWA